MLPNRDSAVDILPMTSAHVHAVAELEQACFSTPWSERSIRGELDNPWAVWLVAADKGRVIGYLGAQYGLDGGDIMTVAVAPEYRRSGIGTDLIAAMSKILQEKHLQWLTLEVRPSNEPALTLYRNLGFRQVGRRPRYYQGPTEDAILIKLYFEAETQNDDSGNLEFLR